LMPDPIVGTGTGRLVLHKFEGGLSGYPDEGESLPAPRWSAEEVEEVASGRRDGVVPEGHPHYRRRRALAASGRPARARR
jgi:hypothetical protein